MAVSLRSWDIDLNRYGSFDVGVGLVTAEGKVLEGEVVELGDGRVQRHRGERARLAGELELRLLEMIGVEVKIAESVHEVTSFIAADLGDHLGEEGVGSDVEGDAKKQVG